MKRLTAAFALALLFVTSIYAQPAISSQVELSIYKITMPMEQGTGVCTGWSINEAQGYVVTAAHCREAHMFADGVEARVVYVNERADLLVLQTTAHKPGLRPAQAVVATGDSLVAMGYGHGQLTILACHVAEPELVNEVFNNEPMLVSDCQYVAGMSGGPVVNAAGELISIVQMGGEGWGYGRTLNEIKDIVGFFGQ